MKKTLYFPILIALFCASTFTSCSDDDETPPAPTKTEMLTGKNWVVTAAVIDPPRFNPQTQTEVSNLIPFIAACKLDDFTKYNSNNQYVVEEGASKCSPNDAQIVESGTWAWNTDQTIIIHSPADLNSYEYKVTSLTTSQLVVQVVEVEQGVTYTLTVTFQ